MRKNILFLGAGLLITVILGAGIACGDDDDNGDTNGDTPTATESIDGGATEPPANGDAPTATEDVDGLPTETPEDGGGATATPE